MNMKSKNAILRLFALLMVVLMLSAAMVSCWKKDEKPEDSKQSSDISDIVDSGSDGDESTYVPMAIKEDFDGYVLTALTRSGTWESNDITAPVVGDVLSQATYMRNATLEKKYNFKIREDKTSGFGEVASIQGSSGQHQYDLWSFNLNEADNFAEQGYCYDLNSISGLNLEAPYYDQSLNKQGSFAGKLFFTVGDMTYLDNLVTTCIVVNHGMWDELKLNDKYGKSIYKMVDDGEWTFEVFTTVVKDARYDLDGNGIYDITDRWGFNYVSTRLLSFNIGFGNEFLTKDIDDVHMLNNSQKQLDDVETIADVIGNRNPYVWFGGAYDGSNAFKEERQLLDETWVRDLIHLVKSSIDYGIVPHPKANEDQEEYYNYITCYATNHITIPVTVAKGDHLDTVANIIELTSYESKRVVSPQLESYIFDGRLYNHVEDRGMLELIFKNRKYELCHLWSTGHIYTAVCNIAHSDYEVGSTFKGLEDAVATDVKARLEVIQKNADITDASK